MNKKILITGHTAGLGSACYEALSLRGNELYGISRRTGYDLSSDYKLVKDRILQYNPDIFINNAYVESKQTQLLKDIYSEWKFLNKMIINIGSVAALIPSDHPDYKMPYAKNKREQRDFCQTHNFNFSKTDFKSIKCKLININFDYIKTDFPSKHDKSKYPNLLPSEAAEVIKYVIDGFENNICFREITAHSNKVI